MKVSELFAGSSFAPFSTAVEEGGLVKAISIPGGASKISATRIKKGDVYQQAVKSGSKGLPYLKVLTGGTGFNRALISDVLVSPLVIVCFIHSSNS